jgi:hypothetical protein
VARLELIRRDGNEMGKIGDDLHVIGKVLDQTKSFNEVPGSYRHVNRCVLCLN